MITTFTTEVSGEPGPGQALLRATTSAMPPALARGDSAGT